MSYTCWGKQGRWVYVKENWVGELYMMFRKTQQVSYTRWWKPVILLRLIVKEASSRSWNQSWPARVDNMQVLPSARGCLIQQSVFIWCFLVALCPWRRDGLFGTGTEWEGGDRVGRGGPWEWEGDDRVKAQLGKPPEKDWRDHGLPPEQWKC